MKKAALRNREALRLLSEVQLPRPWQRKEMCLYRCLESSPPSSLIAAFDFDKTLHFGGTAWRLSSAHIPGQLKTLQKQGYNISIFSNQNSAGKQRTSDDMRNAVQRTLDRFDEFISFCDVPMSVFLAVSRGDIGDPYRKPNIGMWEIMKDCNMGIQPDLAQSFYVGNSAGRLTDGNNVDMQFAKNLGIEFHTEDWFVRRIRS